MMKNPIPSSPTRQDTPLKYIAGIFRAILAVAIVLALMILILPRQVFLAISNYFQIITAIAGALVFLYAYYRFGRQNHLLYAAGAFGLWGASNIAWYVNILMGLRNEVFPSLVDMGMIASILLLTITYQNGFPRKQVPPHVLLGILVIALIIPVGVIITSGITAGALVTLLYFFACASLIVIGLNHSLQDYPKILTGTLLFAIAFMIYPLREMFFITNSALNVIGTLVFAGFSLIVLGCISAGTQPE